MRQQLDTAIRFTVVTTILFGLVYPLIVTGLAQLLFPDRANGQLIWRGGRVVGAKLIGQTFSSPGYFHSRPSAAGPAGYDASVSGGSNLAPTNRKLVERVQHSVERLRAESASRPVPGDLVTSSASGLDPHISPAAAAFQIARVARERRVREEAVRALVGKHTEGRQWGIFGEPHVNVLELNLDLDAVYPIR